ncbi:Hsp70 family protein [Longispora sp. K20-0274]|uniref:Hsp70 family protein n=1 Tax=Longispora sp. K20-0274 TaxID=3088255 RepID=UPI00399C1F99
MSGGALRVATGPVRLAVDLGSAHTVAAVRLDAGQVRTLLFDGSPLLPSGVYADPGRGHEPGHGLVAGAAARAAAGHPERYEPTPKRRIDDGDVLLGETSFPVPDVLAVPLRRVATEAARALGTVPATVLTHPASWGPARRAVLAEAGRRAGLGEVALVAEPVAAAAYFASRRAAPDDRPVAVFDLGAGTLDLAVLAPDGRTVLAESGLDDLGGLDIDAALVDHLAASLPGVDWDRLRTPRTPADYRARHTLWTDVRAAKEMLSRTSVAPVPVPGLAAPAHLTRDELDALAGPLLARAVTATADLLRGAGLVAGDLAGLYLVGGASRLPLVARLLHAGLGVPPVVLEQPELAVAEGALALSGRPPGRHGTEAGPGEVAGALAAGETVMPRVPPGPDTPGHPSGPEMPGYPGVLDMPGYPGGPDVPGTRPHQGVSWAAPRPDVPGSTRRRWWPWAVGITAVLLAAGAVAALRPSGTPNGPTGSLPGPAASPTSTRQGTGTGADPVGMQFRPVPPGTVARDADLRRFAAPWDSYAWSSGEGCATADAAHTVDGRLGNPRAVAPAPVVDAVHCRAGDFAAYFTRVSGDPGTLFQVYTRLSRPETLSTPAGDREVWLIDRWSESESALLWFDRDTECLGVITTSRASLKLTAVWIQHPSAT